MKALAEQIGVNQGRVFDNSLDLYFKVKQILSQAEGNLYVEDAEGRKIPIEVR